MQFCTSCGVKLKKKTPFCTECGAKLTTSDPPQSNQSGEKLGQAAINSSDPQQQRNNDSKMGEPVSRSQHQPVQSAKPSKPLSKKTKILLSSVGAVLLLFFGLFKLGESLTDSDKALASFIEAVETEDVEYLVDHLKSQDENLEVTDKIVEDFLEYINENPFVKNDLMFELERAADVFNGTAPEDSYYPNSFLTFEQHGKKFFIYDNYEFFLHPQSLNLYTNYSDLTFFINEEEVVPLYIEGEYVTLGSFLPGVYDIKGVLKTDFMELEKDLQVNLFYEVSTDFYLDIDYISIDTTLTDVSVFINGKDTGMILQPDGDSFGPVLLDGSMEFHLEREAPFGKMVSPSYSINEYYYYPVFTLLEDQQNAVFETINDHLFQWGTARASHDKSGLEHVMGYYEEYLFNSIDNLISYNEFYFGQPVKTTFDVSSLQVYYNDGNWITSVSVMEEWKGTYVSSNGNTYSQDDIHELNYSLTYNEGNKKWIMSHVDPLWGYFDETNLKEFTFEGNDQQEAVAEQIMALTAQNEENFQSLFYSFVSNSVDAINNRDFSIVSPWVDPDNADYRKEMSDYIDYLDTRDIYEDFIDVEVKKVDRESDDLFHVSTYEEYVIYYGDGSAKFKGFDSEYLVRLTGDGLKVHKLLKTTEVESKDW
ncbi:TcaA NTF2-like domain-containing protein [Evansella tamaricis]|uniref:Zinc-ribbon domain-containing protein n=1 Tax=Evansella tamaricis TaxID=2069301 RepID=A0ABS6JGH8_9BACI|nr:hypothetical protein [Evansella tamaricis]MBU9712752.1 hypothetical protein [Evansella tamaricis]